MTLMRLKDAELADLKTLDAAQGLTWTAEWQGGPGARPDGLARHPRRRRAPGAAWLPEKRTGLA